MDKLFWLLPRRLSSLRKLVWLRLSGAAAEIWRTITAAIATFTAVAAPLRQLSVAVEPVQNLNGYDHPWPAGGGKNKFNPNSTSHEWVNGSNQITTLGSAITNRIPVTEGTTICLSQANAASASNVYMIAILDENDNVLARSTYASGQTTLSRTVPTGGTVAIAGFFDASLVSNPQFEVGASATSFAPYENICPITGRDSVKVYHSGADTSNPTVYTIQLGETVYGGTLDVVNGTMTVDRGYVTFDGTETWSQGVVGLPSISRFFTTLADGIKNGAIISNVLVGGISQSANAVRQYLIAGVVMADCYPPKAAFPTVNDWKAYLENNNMQVVYELATPFELTLTPEQISTLQGTNNVWSDAGDVTVEYRAQ